MIRGGARGAALAEFAALAALAALAAVVLPALGGCGPKATSGWTRGAGRDRGAQVREREFTPAGEPAARYNDPARAPAPSTPLGDALAAAVGEAAAAMGLAPPAADGRLYAAAGDLAALIEDGALPSYDAIEFALSWRGIIEPFPELIVVEVADGDVDGIVAAVREKLPDALLAGSFARLGVGVAPAGRGLVRVVLALQESGLETEPIPRRLPAGGSARLRGRVVAPYADPVVYVTGADGMVDQLPVAREGAEGFRAELRCGPASGRRQVEIIGRGPRGVTVLANFPVWCGEDPPRRLVVLRTLGETRPVRDAEEAEQTILELMNEDRRRAGLPPLAPDARAAAVARAHSRDMHDHGFVAHVSPTTGSAADRMRAAGLASTLVLENVARAYSPEEAQAGFMNSPGHRANVLSRDATHVGIGVVLGREVAGRRELYVTQVFYRVPPRLEVGEGRRVARRVIAEARERNGLRAIIPDPALDAIAQNFADGLAKDPTAQDRLAEASDRQLDAVSDRFAAAVTVIAVVGSPGEVVNQATLDPAMSHYGIGLAQGNDPRLGQGAIYVVIVLARTR